MSNVDQKSLISVVVPLVNILMTRSWRQSREKMLDGSTFTGDKESWTADMKPLFFIAILRNSDSVLHFATSCSKAASGISARARLSWSISVDA